MSQLVYWVCDGSGEGHGRVLLLPKWSTCIWCGRRREPSDPIVADPALLNDPVNAIGALTAFPTES